MPTTIINASAGSGKTYRLAVAYLQALLQPLPDGSRPSPQSVLATTFTRAAASEILERVLRRLALAVMSDEEAGRLLREIERPDLGRADLTRLLESICQILPQLQVGTIDGLFSRIVHVVGLDLAFPPSWTVADDSMTTGLALEAANQILSGADVRVARDQWRRYAQFKPGLQVRVALKDLLEDNRFSLIDGGIAEDDPSLKEPEIFRLSEAEELISALETFEVPMRKSKLPGPNTYWVKAMEKIKSFLSGEPTLISILKGHQLVHLVNVENSIFSRVPVPDKLREILGPLAARAREDLRRLHEARLPALAALGRRYHELRQIVAHARRAYRFPEIEAAVRLLPPHLSADDLYFRLDGRIQHLLLDEFQDTSLGQFRFLWPIIENVRANGCLFFAVGDVKQSIYGWRGADRHLLDRLPGWLDPAGNDPHLKHEQLPDNRRSGLAVLRAIDLVFRNLEQAACLNPLNGAEDKKSRLKVRQAAAARFISGYQSPVAAGENRYLAGRVRLLLAGAADAENDAEDDETSGEVQMILAAVEQHRCEDPDREIAILLRRHKLMPAILAGLRMRNIPASGEGGNPVGDSAAVELVFSMLTWLDHPGHTLAREHVKLSGVAEVFGFQKDLPDTALLKQTRVAIMRRGLAAVIADWIRHEQFRRKATLHDQVRSEQLVELARRWDAAGGGRLSVFVEGARSRRVDNPASSQVRVMTIHRSKGLEFEAVILADIEAGWGGGDGPRLAVTMSSPNVLPKVTLLPNAEDAELLGLEAEYEQYQQAQFEEELSVLYVALTRAKSYLDVVLPAKKSADSLLSILRERWGQQNPGWHVVAEYAATPSPSPEAPVPAVAGDSGIWTLGDDLDVAKIRLAPGRLESITPSGQEGVGIVKLGLILNAGDAAALERGTAVHALLSRIAWIDQLPSQRDWLKLIPADEADSEACRIAARELHPRLSDPDDPLAKIFSPDAWMRNWKNDGVVRLEVWRERRFATIIGQELMNGSYDRVVLGLDSSGKRVRAEILDFKTDRLKDEIERHERLQQYQPQLDAYLSALAKLTALPFSSISARLVWINAVHVWAS